MKAEMDEQGRLIIKGESALENYALAQWWRGYGQGGPSVFGVQCGENQEALQHGGPDLALLEIGRTVMRELDVGSDYMESRSKVAQLSGLPAMAVTFDGHIEKIKERLGVLNAGS